MECCTIYIVVIIPSSVTEIGNSAFEACFVFTSAAIPNSVTVIGERAFKDCLALTSVTIPNSMTLIGYGASSGYSRLTSVYVEWKDTNELSRLSSEDFPYSTCKLYVPIGTNTIYQNKSWWKTFRNIYEYKPKLVLLGDANVDGNVNVNDITTTAAIIIGGNSLQH